MFTNQNTTKSINQLNESYNLYWKEFVEIISHKKTNVMSEDVTTPPSISIEKKVFEVTKHCSYLESAILYSMEIDLRIAKSVCVIE